MLCEDGNVNHKLLEILFFLDCVPQKEGAPVPLNRNTLALTSHRAFFFSSPTVKISAVEKQGWNKIELNLNSLGWGCCEGIFLFYFLYLSQSEATALLEGTPNHYLSFPVASLSRPRSQRRANTAKLVINGAGSPS